MINSKPVIRLHLITGQYGGERIRPVVGGDDDGNLHRRAIECSGIATDHG